MWPFLLFFRQSNHVNGIGDLRKFENSEFSKISEVFMLPPSVALYLFYTHTSTVLRRSRDITWPTFYKKLLWPQFLHRLWPCASTFDKKSKKKISKILGQKVIRSDFRLERKSCVEKWNLGTHQFKSHLHFSTLGAFNLFSGQKLNFWSDFWNERINVL